MLETVVQDLRIGLRVLVKEKTFCALAVVVLALGICGVATMFGVVDGVMLRGFSFPTASRLVVVRFIDPSTGTGDSANGQISSMDFEELQPVQHSFELMVAFLDGSTVNATVNGHPQRYTGAYVTENFLRMLGMTPFLGRDFTAADNAPGAEKVAIVGYGVWQRDFGGAPDIVGRAVRINGKSATIIGVMPKGFAFPTNEELWLPLYSDFPVRPRNDPSAVNPGVVALLKPGVSLDEANAEITGIARRFAAAYPDTNKQFNAGLVEPLIQNYTPRQLRGTLWTMLGFCVGVLLIACVNVMNMQFARATLRARELAVRASLGATRGRLIRQMLTESLLVAAIGATIGVGLAYFATDWLSATVHNLETPPPAWMTFDIDGRVLVFIVLATLAAALVSGLLPAWQSSRANVVEVLKEGGRGSTSGAVSVFSRGLVVFQIVVTCVLLIGSILQLRSILNQQTIDYGYDTRGVLSARMGLMNGDYADDAARKLFYDRVTRELARAPEFDAVGLSNRFRMMFSGNAPIEIEGRVYKETRDRPKANWEQVTAGVFDVMGQKLLEGRTFTDDDLDAKQPVAIVNAAFARRHFGTESAIGRRFRAFDAATQQPGPWRTIVGAVSTVRMLGPFTNPGLDDTGYYVPFYSTAAGAAKATPVANQFTTVVVRPRGGERAELLANALRREVNKVDPNLPLYFVGTPQSQFDSFIAQNRIIVAMFLVFGAVAVLLASVGIYGVMSFAVNQRAQEFGVRMALGADDGRILAMVLKQGSVQLGVGLLLGMGVALAIAAAGGSAIQNVLFGVSARDPLTYVTVAALVAVVSIAATLVPARRAAHVDPMVALRAE